MLSLPPGEYGRNCIEALISLLDYKIHKLSDLMKPLNIPEELTTDVSYLAGIISGDGTMAKYFIKIYSRLVGC